MAGDNSARTARRALQGLGEPALAVTSGPEALTAMTRSSSEVTAVAISVSTT